MDFNPAAEDSSRKILDRSSLKAELERRRASGDSIVFTNGCFDLIHVGHLRYLEAAKKLGDRLIVAINSDDSIERLKGPSRPILPEQQRARVLAALACVDYVTVFEEDTPDALLELLRPEILVKGANYGVDGVVGRDFVEAYGGKVLTVELTEGRSTTAIIEKVQSGA